MYHGEGFGPSINGLTGTVAWESVEELPGAELEDGEPRFDERTVAPGFPTGLTGEVEFVETPVVSGATVDDHDWFAPTAFEDGPKKEHGVEG